MSQDPQLLKSIACEAIEKWSSELEELSGDIWRHPELALQEHHAHDALTSFLTKAGFQDVQRHFVLDTGFCATVGRKERPHVAMLCEYDALPEMGHACGHNLIAELGVAAGIGVKAALEEAESQGRHLGKIGPGKITSLPPL